MIHHRAHLLFVAFTLGCAPVAQTAQAPRSQLVGVAPAPTRAASAPTAKEGAAAESLMDPAGPHPFHLGHAEAHPAPRNLGEAPAHAMVSASGVGSYVVEAPTDPSSEPPVPGEAVVVHYSGWTQDGRLFDSSLLRGRPAFFKLGSLIKGLDEGLTWMRVGEIRRFWIPTELAYGESPERPGAPAGPLTFDVQLLKIQRAPISPADVAEPPSESVATPMGVRYVALETGAGELHPGIDSRVRVHYSGWTTDGRLFDSSLLRGRPATFGVSRVIAGWTDVLQLMVAGDKWRVWIPSELAYGETPGRPGVPLGMLVFEIELLEVIDP